MQFGGPVLRDYIVPVALMTRGTLRKQQGGGRGLFPEWSPSFETHTLDWGLRSPTGAPGLRVGGVERGRGNSGVGVPVRYGGGVGVVCVGVRLRSRLRPSGPANTAGAGGRPDFAAIL
eukprot:COSAG02_NODE_325_length_24616_cov_17.214667_11_plen_118_part_00